MCIRTVKSNHAEPTLRRKKSAYAKGVFFVNRKRHVRHADNMVAATDLVEFAKTHLPILLGTQVTVSRKEIPRPVNRDN